MAKMWKQCEVWDGTYTFSDLLDAHEILAVENENQHRAHEHDELQRSLNR